MKLPKHRRDEAALNSRLIRRPIKRMVWLVLLPTFGAFCIGFLYPFFKGLFLSFCNFRITSQWTWTGLENYRKAFQDPGYMHAFWYTALFALVSLIAINLFAFAIAYALTQKFKGTNVFRTVFFLPNLIGGIVLGYIWSMIFDGILIKYNTSVVLETKYGFWGLVILVCWQQIGYMMIIYIAGLQAVPEDMLEAARIDGAGEFYTFNHIVLPIMKPALAVQAIFSFVASWNNYFIPALVLDSADKKTLPILIAQLRSADFLKFDMGKVYMMVAIAILPVIVVYLLLSKFIVRGIALGGVKG